MVRRTVLFSPGDQPGLLRKAPDSGADVIVFDLEDAVAPGQKENAREVVAETLADLDPESELCVRVNPLAEGGRRDVEALFEEGGAETVDSVMLPKVDSAGAVDSLSSVLGEKLPVLALLETATGVLQAKEIAGASGTDAVLLGAEDLVADIGASRSTEGTEILHARERTVLAASHAGVDAIDTLYTDYQDTDGLRKNASFGRDLGFDGKMAIHPSQVSVINDAFTPDEEQIEWARKVLQARDEAAAEDRGVFSVEGEMIDAPLISQAEDVIERADVADRT